MSVENVAENQGTFGRLKPVSRGKSDYSCDECKETILKGDPHYTQSDYTGEEFFPRQRRVCKKCGEKLISEGTEIKTPKQKPKKKKGCGKETDCPKPDRSGMWKCGEEAPIVGILYCKECHGGNDEQMDY